MNDAVVKTTFQVVPTTQDELRLFVGVAKAKDLIKVTAVDRYNPAWPPTDQRQGYQRPAERSRITRIGRYLTSGEGGGLFPTAVLLSSRKPLEYDRMQGIITVSSDQPLQIIDGQHRIAGLRYAIEEKGADVLGETNMPVVIIETPDRAMEMNQFRIVNGTAKQVRTDLVNMILISMYSDTERGNIPPKELWRIVVSNVADRLAKDPSTPWHQQIALPGEVTVRGEAKAVRATSFITSLRPVYIWLKDVSGLLDQKANHTTDDEIDYVLDVVANFWRALQDVVPEAFEDPAAYVIQKTPGVFSLHLLLRHLLRNMFQGHRKFDRETFAEFLRDSPEVTDPDFWHSGADRASVYGSMKGFQDLYEMLSIPYTV